MARLALTSGLSLFAGGVAATGTPLDCRMCDPYPVTWMGLILYPLGLWLVVHALFFGGALLDKRRESDD